MKLLENIPVQLAVTPQWVAWRSEDRGDGKETKVPYQPYLQTLLRASPTNPAHWGRMRDAVGRAYCMSNDFDRKGAGFVLTPNLGMICIDLDDPSKLGPNAESAKKLHDALLEEFSGTYKERSPSQTGYHIWLFGVLPEERMSVSLKDKAGIEIYAGARYMTMTGIQYGMCDQMTNQQAVLDRLIQYMIQINGGALPGTAIGTGEVEESEALGRRADLSDEQVIQQAIRNNSRFLEFYNSTPPSDRSRFAKPVAGDLDKITALPEQILRIMLSSPIGRCYVPADLERKLYKYWLPEARNSNLDILKKREEGRIMQQRMMEAEEQRQIALDAAEAANSEKTLAESAAPFKSPFKFGPHEISRYATDWPPGMIGALAQEIRERATMRASKDFAIASALSLFAGLSGHAYSFERVNGALYMLLLGTSGQGKEAPAEARDVLATQLRSAGVPGSVLAGLAGPSKITSPQGLHRRLETDKTLLCILGESTLWLSDLANAKQNVTLEIKRFVLDLYGKQGRDRKLSPAEILNKDNKLATIVSPACTMLMEGEPSVYFELLGNDAYTASGLAARIVHVVGASDDMPVKNYNSVSFSNYVVSNIAGILPMWHNKRLEQNATLAAENAGMGGGLQNGIDPYIQVGMTEQCVSHHRAFDRELDFFGRDNVGRVSDIFNRIVPNVLRVAVNIAAGVNPYNPLITMEIYLWAQEFVLRGLMHMMGKIETGAVGTGDNRVRQMIHEVLARWAETSPRERKERLLSTGQVSGDDKRAMLSKLKGIPVSMLQRALATRIARHVNAERATMILKAMLRDMVETGEVVISNGATEGDVSFNGQIAFLAEHVEL